MDEVKKDLKTGECQNCGQSLTEEMKYCPKCGQKILSGRITLSYFIQELLNNYFSFDSKFFLTIKPLLFKPAFLSFEFISGRRIRYINPVQLFVFISFLYFLVDSFMILKEVSYTKDFVVMKENGKQISSDSLNSFLLNEKMLSTSDSAAGDFSSGNAVGDFIRKSQEFNQLEKDEQNERVSKMISYFIFLLMPLFALFLNWIYGRRYLENLIFSLHFHSFFFLTGTFFMLADRIIPDPYDEYLFGAALFIYLLVALKAFYKHKLPTTLIRFVGLFVMYGFIVVITYLVSIVISIYL